jgi:hypothetical protein
VTVNANGGSYAQCLESESSSGNGSITSDPNASNGQTRGDQNDYNHYVDYALTGVPSAGTYYVTLRYYSSAAPTVGVQVNGGSTTTVNLANSNSWNIVWTNQTFTVTLAAGSNTLRIAGTGGGSCRQDRICVSNSPGGSALMLNPSTDGQITAKKALMIAPNPSNGVFNAGFYLQKGKQATLTVLDLHGRVIYRQSVTGQGQQTQKINLNNKAAGNMLLQLHTDEGIQMKKITVVR